MVAYNLYAYCSNNPVMHTDPSGHAILTAFLIGLAIGAAIGFTSAIYEDYEDDGEVFNGSVDVADYVDRMLVGAAVGGAIGAASPIAGTLLTSGFASGSVALAGGGTVAISGTQMIGGAVVLTGTILHFASNKRPGDNKKQNQQFKDAMKHLNVTNKDKMRRVHDKIKGKNMGYNELVQFIREVLNIK